MNDYSAIYAVIIVVICLLSPSVILGMGWLASQNEKTQNDNPSR